MKYNGYQVRSQIHSLLSHSFENIFHNYKIISDSYEIIADGYK